MHNGTFIIFGASGDLARRKLLPALYELSRSGFLTNYAIVGVAYNDIPAHEILHQIRPFIRIFDEDSFQRFSDRFSYQRLDFMHQPDFINVAAHIKEREGWYGLPGNRVIYVAAASSFYCAITENCALSGIAYPRQQKTLWQRIVYEKPFGHDAQSAQEVNACIATYFDENQVYRIDHYLTKELVSNIALVRFTNIVFEPLWNNRFIESVQIILSESEGINDRGAYYDTYGALKDMVQNHMLELLALICMETPTKLTGEHIRAERAKLLANVQPVDAVLGQYDGYRQEKHVASDSTTETFVAACVQIDNPRWKGVPFYLKTGKCLTKKESIIHIKFKHVDCLLTKNCPSDSNWLSMRVAPDPAFFLTLNAKKPGALHEVVPVQMEFAHNRTFGHTEPESYEIIFKEIIRSEHSISVRFDEIESAWSIVDAIAQKAYPLYIYTTGSTGPREIEIFEQNHKMRWRS